jgi:hypothetical protein
MPVAGHGQRRRAAAALPACAVPGALPAALALAALLALGAFLAFAAPPARAALRFDSELIRLEIRGDTLRVDGLYRYLATSRRQPLLLWYPYPVDSLLGAAWTESLAWRSGPEVPWAPLAVQERPDGEGVHWSLPLGEGDRVEARTVYCQLLCERYGRYIVTTTRAWGAPLREARFELRLPPGMQLAEASYPFVREGELWVYAARDFWPSADIVFRWEPAPPAAESR